ncbi:hypothetical protein ABLA30_19710 [Xenorhabdus nematophila]|uniref:hypothetical protein n=1 Tax=Xenorhabdus nematophila TaxID=628 RepID=UPI0032B8466B
MKIIVSEDNKASLDCPVSDINVDLTNSVSDITEDDGDISIRTVVYANGGKAIITTNHATKKFNLNGENISTLYTPNKTTPESATITVRSN